MGAATVNAGNTHGVNPHMEVKIIFDEGAQ